MLRNALEKKRNLQLVDANNKIAVVRPEELSSGCEEDVVWLSTADVKTDLPEILLRHKKTFELRRKLDQIQILEKFPRFFDIQGLVSKSFIVLGTN